MTDFMQQLHTSSGGHIIICCCGTYRLTCLPTDLMLSQLNPI